MYRKLAMAVMGVTMSATMVLAQNARMQALGNPNIGMTNLIDDVSDVLTFPSEVIENPDVVHGALGITGSGTTEPAAALPGYIYASKTFYDMLAIGFLFGKPTYVSGSTIDGTQAGFNDWTNNGYIDFRNAATTEMGRNPALIGGLAAPGTPSNAGHLLVGADMSGLKLGIDLFREAANSESASKTEVGTNITETESTNKIGALGAIAGLSMDMGSLKLKGSAGFVNFSLKNENITKTTVTTTSQLFQKEGGIFLPVSVKATLPMGSQNITGAADFAYSSAQFSAANDNGTTVTEVTTATFSNMYLSIGVADEIEIAPNTKLIAALAFMQSTSTQTPETTLITTARQEKMSTTVLPAMSLGIEHRIEKFWKTDALVLRAGGAKTNAWDSNSDNWNGGGSEGTSSSSGNPTTNAFTWSTGCTIEKGNLALDMVINPGSWNGVYLFNARGPVTGNVTLTYHFGGASSSTSSPGSYDSYTPSYESPSYETPSYGSPSDDNSDF